MNNDKNLFNYSAGRYAKGYTLLELMISLSLAAAMIMGCIIFYVMMKQSSVHVEASRGLIESGRFAIEQLNRSVRMARYWGCTGANDADAINHLREYPAAAQPGMTMQGIYGEDGVGPYGEADAFTVFQVAANTETAIIDIDDPLNVSANPDPLSTTAVIKVAQGSGFEAGDYIVISDCTQGDIMKISKVTVVAGAADAIEIAYCSTCAHAYKVPGSLIQRINRIRYSVRENKASRPGLYIQENDKAAAELIDGIEDMQIYYAQDIDADGSGDRYVLPAVVNKTCNDDGNKDCWRRVSNVRISVLLRSINDNVVDEAQTYQFDGVTYTAKDRHFRRDFTTIAALRNHR